MRSSLVQMRSSLVFRASDHQCTSCIGPGFDPSIRRHSGILRAADEALLNIVRKKNSLKKYIYIYIYTTLFACVVMRSLMLVPTTAQQASMLSNSPRQLPANIR